MKCPQCHEENPDSARFCSKCGTRFTALEESPTATTQTMQPFGKEVPAGKLFASRYEVIEELGGGGMGTVYRVRDRQIDEDVALKVLKPEIASDKLTMERFRNELKLARKISHVNVCRMYHIGEEEGAPYITMEYVAGEDLAVRMKRAGALEVPEAVSIARQVCAGLAEAHRIGVIHRDLKPQNIMIDKKGKPRIMDFGIARSTESTGSTEAGMIVGTPDYMAPEQVSGRNVDARCDIYALGVIMFEMVTGRRLFEADTPLGILMKHKTMMPQDPREINPHVPVELSQIILRCLEKEKENRYAGADELHAELESLEERLTPEGEVMPPPAREGQAGLFLRKNLRWAALAALVVGALLAAWLIKRALTPKPRYEKFILVDLFEGAPKGINKELFEYMVLRSLTASTTLNILSQQDFAVYRKNIAPKGETMNEPVITVTARAAAKVAGFEIYVTVKHEGKTRRRTFTCKGTSDLLLDKLPGILEFISGRSGGLITAIEGKRTFAQIATDNLDALGHFLQGEAAWGKLDSDTAYFEYKTAVENDPRFALASLQLADVQVFRMDLEDARVRLQAALKEKGRLIRYDLIRLWALMARIDSKPAEERQYLQQLTEAFPFRKEYHYEFAESYFHTGDADEAIKHYMKALELDPDYSLAHNHIAYAYAWAGDHARAEEHFKKYIELDHTANSYDSLAAGYMFAGRYDDAIDALGKGIELSPTLDYLYRNMACNYLLKGALKKAEEYFSSQMKITRLDDTVVDASFYMAYIELMRGNADRTARELIPVREYYAASRFEGRLDDYPNFPFWLTGVAAYRKGDAKTLGAMLKIMEKKIFAGGVTATNYFPIYKLYVHLKILEGDLEHSADKVLAAVAEGQGMKKKMGYWDSIFDLPFFFNEYAAVLVKMDKTPEARALLDEALAYNPSFAPARINLAKIYLKSQETAKARKEYQAAWQLLKDADKDLALFDEMAKIKSALGASSP